MATNPVKLQNTRLKILRSLRGKLTLVFLIVSIVPLVAVGLLAFIQSQNALQTEITNKLIASRDLKARQIETYFETIQEDVSLTAKFPEIAKAAQDFEQATKQLGGVATVRSLGYLNNPNLINAGKNDAYDVAHTQYSPLFNDLVKTRGYYDMFLVSLDGDVVYTYAKEDDFGTNLLDGPYRDTSLATLFQKLQTETSNGKVILTDFSPYAPSKGAPASFVGTPIIQDGKNMGVLIYHLPMDRIKTLMQDTTGLGQSGETYLIGPDKLMRSDSRFSQESTILKQEINTEGVKAALDDKSGSESYTDYRGVPVIGAYRSLKIGELKWVLIAEVDQEEAFAEAIRLRNLTLFIIVVAALVVAGVGFFVARSIANPVQTITHTAIRLATGDVNQTVNIHSGDEIGQMADSFRQMIAYQQQMAGAASRLAQGDVTATITPQSDQDALGHAFRQMVAYQQQMAETANRLAQGDLTAAVTPQSDQDALGNAFRQMIVNLRDLISQVADTANTVGVASDQLSTAAEQAGQATQQVAGTIQQIAQGASQQTQAVTEATNNVEQMARASEGIARGAQEQAQGITKTSELTLDMAAIVTQVGQTTRSVSEANAKVTQAARLGVSTVGQTSQGMDAIRARTLAAADKVKEMGSRSKEIGRIVETIDEIADKTDMLALNAAVEAARAGEYGRGFAVVADQVRKLSEDSKVATRDIGQLIERVQDTIHEAIAAMDSTMVEVDNGTRLTGDTTRSLGEILQAAENAAVMAEQIATAVNQLKQKK